MVQKAIGALLKERRTKLDWSLDKAEKTTSIKKIYISALETESFAIFPGPFYVRAYLKQYAQKLDLDVEAILEAFDNHTPVEVEGPFEDTGNYRFIRPDERLHLPNEEEDEENKTWVQRYLPMLVLATIAGLILISVGLMVILNLPKAQPVTSVDYSLSTSSSSQARQTSLSLSSDGKSLQIFTNQEVVNLHFDLSNNASSATASASGNVTQSITLTSVGQKSAEFSLESRISTSTLTFTDIKAMVTTINGQLLDLSKVLTPSNVINLQVIYNATGLPTPSTSSVVGQNGSASSH